MQLQIKFKGGLQIPVQIHHNADVEMVMKQIEVNMIYFYPTKASFRKQSRPYIHRPISQTVFMLPIAINRAKHICATVVIKHNYMLMCNHKIVINIMLCLLYNTGRT